MPSPEERHSATVNSGNCAELDDFMPLRWIRTHPSSPRSSVAIGASAAGARAYTATSSQGLLFMAEAVYNAGGLGLPIVMTLGNRAIGAPINIWNDHSDAMSMRDAGWIQLFAKDNQEAVDLHVQAFRLAEALSCPVMVCVDGFILTHAVERVDVPSQDEVDAFLPPYEPVQVLDVDEPVTIGAMVGPEAFAEVRWLAHQKQLRALEMIPEIAAAFAARVRAPVRGAAATVPARGRGDGGRRDGIGQRHDRGGRGRDARRRASRSDRSTSARSGPFPPTRSARHCRGAKRVVVLEKNLALGMGGVLASRRPDGPPRASPRASTPSSPGSVAARSRGPRSRARFGRRTPARSRSCTCSISTGRVVERELARGSATRRSGPTATNVLRDVGPSMRRIA